MHSFSTLLALGAFFSAVQAIPMKRDIVTEVDTVVEMVTATVWVDATDALSAQSYGAPTSAPAAATTATEEHPAPPTPTSSASSYVAPPPPPPSTTSAAPPPPPSTTQAPPPPPPTTQAPPPPPPAPTSEAPPPPPPSPTTAAPPAPPATTSAAPAPSSGGSSGGGQKYSGADITFYDLGLGSCGETNAEPEHIAAIAVGIMDKATMCGKTVTIQYGDKTTTAKVQDTCMGCTGTNIDLSHTAFRELASEDIGRGHGATWWFN